MNIYKVPDYIKKLTVGEAWAQGFETGKEIGYDEAKKKFKPKIINDEFKYLEEKELRS